MTRKTFRNQVLKMYITFKYSHSTDAGYIKRRKGQGTRFLGWQWKDKKQKSEQWKRKRNLKQVAEQPTERDTAGQETEWKRQTDREREGMRLKNDTCNGVQRHTFCPEQPHAANTLLRQPASQIQSNIQSLKERETQTDTSVVTQHSNGRL